MTERRKLERRVQWVRRIAMTGLVLYLPVVGSYYVPWLAVFGAAGAMACALAVVLAYAWLRCPRCKQELLRLVLARSGGGQGFRLPNDFTMCPHCGHDFEEHDDLSQLPEFLSSLERDGRFVGVMGIPAKEGHRKYEIILAGAAREAFQRVLQLHPFDATDAIGYHFYFLPPSGTVRNEDLQRQLRVMVRKGERSEVVNLSAPKSLTSLLRWLADLDQDGTVLTVRIMESA